MAGDDVTGVCVMQVAEGLDTGDVYASVDVPIGPRATAAELRGELVDAGTALLVDQLRNGLGRPTPQVGEPTYAAKITPEELRIDWTRPAIELDRLVRVGGAWTTWRGNRIKVIEAEIVDGRLVPTVVQPEGQPADAVRRLAPGCPVDRRRVVRMSTEPSARRIAYDALRRIESHGAYANLVMRGVLGVE